MAVLRPTVSAGCECRRSAERDRICGLNVRVTTISEPAADRRGRLQQRILVVDDEPSIVDAVATALRYEGFEVLEARTGRDGLTAAQTSHPDLIILDVMLPDIDGLEVARRVRADGFDTPVLFLSARDALADKIAGFSAGGDDYVTKPFSLAEIVARVRAILLRTSATTRSGNQLVFADLVLDPESREVSRAGTPIELTATEFNLLQFFLMNPRRVLSKPQILDHVWHYDFDGDSNILETYISYLRKKINRLGTPLIQTIRLVGYVLRDNEADA